MSAVSAPAMSAPAVKTAAVMSTVKTAGIVMRRVSLMTVMD